MTLRKIKLRYQVKQVEHGYKVLDTLTNEYLWSTHVRNGESIWSNLFTFEECDDIIERELERECKL